MNLLSLSGHGVPEGCCGLDVSWIVAFRPTGLVYADSCLTNAFTQDALGPLLVRSAFGATSYVGNSRWSWIGSGSIKEQTFWDVLTQVPILGIAHNSKSLQVTDWVGRWQNYTLNLMGDPAMSVWLGSPSPMEILALASLPVGDPFTVRAVTDTGAGIGGARVTVSSAMRGVIANGRTNADGVATLGIRARQGEVLDVVVTAPGAAPAETTVSITRRR